MVPLILWLVASLPLLSQEAHGTAAIMIWSPERVVLATDSKITHLKGEPPSQACKIRPVGKFFFAASGFYGRPGSDFDAWSAIAFAVRNAKTVPEAAAISEKEILGRIKAVLERVESEDPVAYARAFRESLFAVFFVGVDSGRPVAAGWSLLRNGEILRQEYPGDKKVLPDSRGFITFGEHGATDTLTPGRIFSLLDNPVSGASRILQLEIDYLPSKVGPPISILEVTPAGHRWVEKGECGEKDK